MLMIEVVLSANDPVLKLVYRRHPIKQAQQEARFVE